MLTTSHENCFKCGGSGTVQGGYFYGPPCDWESWPEECPSCEGSGMTGDGLIKTALMLGFEPPRGGGPVSYETLICFINENWEVAA